MLRKMVVVGLLVGWLSGVVVAAEMKDETVRSPGTTKETQESGSYWSDAGYGTLAVVANVVYMPAKILYAGVGTLTGGLAYLLTVGDTDTAERIWSPSIGGNYVVTPAMLHGEEPILFNGPSYSNG